MSIMAPARGKPQNWLSKFPPFSKSTLRRMRGKSPTLPRIVMRGVSRSRAQDMFYSEDHEAARALLRSCAVKMFRGGFVYHCLEDSQKTLKNVVLVAFRPSSGHFVQGMFSLALARSDESAVPKRHFYAIRALRHFRFFEEENPQCTHLDLVRIAFHAAQRIFINLKIEALTATPPSQEALEMMKWWERKGELFKCGDQLPLSRITKKRSAEEEVSELVGRLKV